MEEQAVQPEVVLGIKELKEALIGVNELSILIASRMKDGAGLDDAMAIWEKLKNDEDFKNKMVAAYEGIGMVPAELKQIDLAEGIELAMLQAGYVPKIIAAIK